MADPIEAMREVLEEALNADSPSPGVPDSVARAAWGLALFWLENLDVKGSALVEVIEFLEAARSEILGDTPGG